jgi:ribose transport system permease protein
VSTVREDGATAEDILSPGAGPSAGRARIFLQTYGIVVVAALLVGVVALGNGAFLSPINVQNMLSQWAPAGLMAIGMTYVIIAGGFDLSISATFSLCAVVAAAVAQTYSPVWALVAAIGCGGIVGLINAGLIARFAINPFITTVGTGFVVTGITFVSTENAAIVVSDPAFSVLGAGRWHGLPYSGMLLIVMLAVAAIVLARTVYGRMIYAVGGNAEASLLSGLPVGVVIGSTYVLLGGLSGVAGYISGSQLSSAQSNMDPNILFDVMTIVIVGGTPLGGGLGSIWRSVVGLVIIATIGNGFVLLNISPYYQNIIKGLIIVGALILEATLKKSVRRA